MSLTLFMIAGAFNDSRLLLLDSVKGTALLVLAAVMVLILRRDSAATRHLVWMLAIVALLAVPALSALLPQWRALPEWVTIAPTAAVAANTPPSISSPGVGAVEMPRNAESGEVESPFASAYQPATRSDSRPALVAPEAVPASTAWSWNWLNALPIAWAVGSCVLILRLVAARWMLWNAGRQGAVVWSSRQTAIATDDPIVTAMKSASLQLGICRPVTLLIHPDKTIPVVWGILRCHLLLPAAALQWSGEKLRSVLLHELAHIKRRDTTTQLLAQIACALHWFNPLVWFAAWRLSVERELACDDLVLASGVRPSAYAGHLLDVVTELSSARRTHSCGLAMARKSSLEVRLVAVLSENLNRRGVSAVLAAVGLVIAVGIAVPIAMLCAADEQPTPPKLHETETPKTGTKLWTGKLATGQTRGSADVIPPKHKAAQALLKSWSTTARGDGKFPGAVIDLLGQSVKTFIKNNPTWKTTPQLEKMLPRFDGSRDWSGPDVVALLDELAALQDTPIAMALEHEEDGTIHTGTPLPAELANAPWGEALSIGLRLAWLLEPRTAEHRLGTPLNARILIHNAGKTPVVFRTRSWHQSNHTATDAKGANINVESTHWLTLGQLTQFRLAPGEFVEVNGPGIGVGPVGNHEDWQQTRVGSWIEAKAGDDVTVTTSPVPLSDWNEQPEALGESRWWLDVITARLSRHQPLPAEAEARKLLLYRIAMELFGTPVSDAAFLADLEPTALDSLAKRLFHRPGLHAWSGPLTSGPTSFRVLPADPDAAKKPRTAYNPGRYTVSENTVLVVTRHPNGERLVNEAHISLPAPAEPHQLTLPDGYDTWAAAWVRGTTTIWVAQQGLLRRIDFTNPAKVDETQFETDKTDTAIPPDIREALRAAFKAPAAPKKPANPRPAAPATQPPR